MQISQSKSGSFLLLGLIYSWALGRFYMQWPGCIAAKTWLHFFCFFSVLHLIHGHQVIICPCSCYYSTVASNLFRKNSVQVLATPFLLSYTKIIRAVITAFYIQCMLVYLSGISNKVNAMHGFIMAMQNSLGENIQFCLL